MKTVLIGEYLIEAGLIGEKELDAALAEQARTGARVGGALVSLGCITEAGLLKALSFQFGLPMLSPEDYPGSPPPIQRQPSPKFLREYKVVPVGLFDGRLTVATANPQDSYPLEALRAFTGLKVEAAIGAEKDILAAIDTYHSASADSVNKIIEGLGPNDANGADEGEEDIERLKDMALEAPVVNLVNLLITRAFEKRASDIHMEPFEDRLHVRYRIDGVLYPVESLPKKLHAAVASRVKIMSRLNIAERRLPQDGRIKMRVLEKEIDIRVSTVPTLHGEGIVMRLLDPSSVISLESIGFSEEMRKSFEGIIRQPHGMILVTGPTGSGKSTTLYAALSRIDTVEKKVITIEDPVEYNLEGVNQIQVKPRIGFTFANGLRSIVRQDPDVIMVGEIRDAETADIAIHSALTGHLILSTLHTNDAPGAITRLLDVGVESYLISSSLIAVLAQRLVRVICPGCKEPYAPSPGVLRSMGVEAERLRRAGGGRLDLYRGRGCEGCGGTGYRGRTGIFEMMPVSEELRHMIAGKKGANVLRDRAVEEGMRTLREDGWEKVLSGITTVEEVTRVTLGR